MLSKKLCKKCWGDDWNECDDEIWNEQSMVHCREILIDGSILTMQIDINGEVPKECKMRLEYLVLEQGNDLKKT